jgi:adhesin HecA-like repeat protein
MLSGSDMDLYITDRFRNNEGAMIYAGQDLSIAANAGGGKTKRVENIIATISSGRDMEISAEVLENIGEVSIDYENSYYNTITGQTMTQVERNEWIDARDDFQRWSGSKGDKFTVLNNWLRVYGLYDTVVAEYGVEPSRMGGGTSWTEFVTEVEDRSATTAASISSGRNGYFTVGHLLNKDASISSANDMVLNVGTLDNTPTQESVDVVETVHTMIWNWEDRTWPKDNYTNLYTFYNDVAVSTQEVGGRSQILAGGRLTGNFGTLQNGMETDAFVPFDPNAPTISTGTQVTNETQNSVANIDTNVETPNIENQTQDLVENRPLGLNTQIYDPSNSEFSLPDNTY